MITAPMLMLNTMITGATMLGTTCHTSVLHREDPIASAA